MTTAAITASPSLSGGEVIDLLGRLRGGLDEGRRKSLLDRFDLDPCKKGRAYSKGNRQKVALVAALASDVELLILDEPTAGLDPLMESVFRECIHQERPRGRTVLLSSHILSEVEGPKVTCEVDTGQLGILLERLTSVGVGTLRSAPPTLEELFLRHYAAGTSRIDRPT